MIRLRRFLCCVLVCTPLVWAAGSGSSPKDEANDLKGKVVFLRAMEAGDKLSFDAQGALIGTDTPGSFAYSAVKIETVHRSDTGLEIKGDRVALIFESASESPSLQDIRFVPLKEPTDIVIAVDLQHPEALDGAVKRVFAFSTQEVLSGMSPDDETAALNSLGSTAPVNAPHPPLEGLVSKSALVTHQAGEKGLSRPVLIYSVDPIFKKKSIQGFCLLNLIIDTNGRPEHIRIVHSLDPELDVSIVVAVAQYRYKPAIYQSKAVASFGLINFRHY